MTFEALRVKFSAIPDQIRIDTHTTMGIIQYIEVYAMSRATQRDPVLDVSALLYNITNDLYGI
jgi:hypothetical protein